MSESWYDWQTADGVPARAPAAGEETSGRRTIWTRAGTLLGSRAATWVLLLLVLAAGGYLRLSHVNWDMGTHLHPDERFLTMVESAMRLPQDAAEFFDTTRSPMNPYNLNFGLFVYGTLPMFVVRYTAEAANKFNAVQHLWTAGPGIPLDMTGYDGVHFVGRTLSGIFDLASVWLIFVIARRLYDKRVGLVAAVLYAFAVLPLQQSHFFTVDTFGSFFALLTFYFAVRVAQGGERGRRGGGWPSYLALGASYGATIACRINLLPLLGVAVLAALVRFWDDWHSGAPVAVPVAGSVAGEEAAVQRAAGAPAVPGDEGAGAQSERSGLWLATLMQATLFRLFLMAAMAVIVFRVAQPYAFGGQQTAYFGLLNQQWVDNMNWARASQAGDMDSPPGHQWTSRTPFVFPFVNMVIWGMGLPLGVAAWAGWALAAYLVVRGLTRRPQAPSAGAWRAHLLPVAWIGVMFLWQGLQYVQTMRYLLPLYPLLGMMAAWLLWWLVDGARAWAAGARPLLAGRLALPRTRRITLTALAYGLLALVVIGTLLWGWGFLAIYRRPFSRVTASRWIYAHIPSGSIVANEHWDDALPVSIDGKLSFRPGGEYFGLSTSSDGQMQMYNEDTPEKRELLYQWLDEADYIVLSSNRLYGSIPRLPMRYPMTALYYKLLFEGKLGFEQAAKFTSFPTIFGIQFDDSQAEEAFSVYDHPVVYIFKKSAAYDRARVRAYFNAIDLEETIQMWPKQVSAAPTALLLPAADAARQQAGGTWSAIFNPGSLANRAPVLAWLLLVELLGLVAFPLSFSALRGLSDRGYGVSKVLGILLLAWLSWIGPALKGIPYQRWEIALALVVLVAACGYLAWRRRLELAAFLRARSRLLLAEEAVFLLLFALFLAIRWGNPDLWHPARGGEKPMDFAYLNAVIKSTTFPPYDPWFGGGFLSYYYFGFVIVGTLIKLTGIVPWVAYNLAVPTLFALTGTGAFTVAYSLAAGDPASVFPGEVEEKGGLWLGPLLAGMASVFFVTLIGNLGEARLIWDQLIAHSSLSPEAAGPLMRGLDGALGWLLRREPLSFPNDWWFWNASRIIPDTINEFPFFTFTYADLHAHMIALPLTLLALATAVCLVRNADFGSRLLDFRIGDPQLGMAESVGHRTPALTFGRVPDPQIEPSPWVIERSELALIVLFGFLAGALRATNTWDFPTYLLVGLAALGAAEVHRRLQAPFPGMLDDQLAFLLRALAAVLWRMVILVAAATVSFYPYTRSYATAYAGLQSWSDAKTAIPDYLIVHGFFLVMAGIYLLGEWWAQARAQQAPPWLHRLFPFVLAAVTCVVLAGLAMHVTVWIIALPLLALAIILSCGRDVPPARRLALWLIALALAITMGVEVVRQKDDIGRMNTVFKFYMQAWVLFGVATAAGLGNWAVRALHWPRATRRLAWALAAVLFAMCALYPPLAARAKVLDRFSAEDQPHTLDGMAYMDKAEYFDNNRDMLIADDKAGIEWMLHNVQGSPVILEGNTPGYRWGNRYAIYTGLPAVMGWDWHERQQRSVVPGTLIDRRLNHVKEMYSTSDVARAEHLLDYYSVEYIVVGELERAYYPAEGLAKFDEMVSEGYLKLAYDRGSVRIYQVVGRGKATDRGSSGRIDLLPFSAPGVTAQ